MLQTVFTWLRGYPSLDNLAQDSLCAAPGSAGLFCKGLTLLSRKTDILGRETRRQRLQLELQRHVAGDTGAQWLMDFTRWAESTAPILGQESHFTCGKGQQIRCDAQGVSRYSLQLTFEFTQEV